jgi:hypothetical protein
MAKTCAECNEIIPGNIGIKNHIVTNHNELDFCFAHLKYIGTKEYKNSVELYKQNKLKIHINYDTKTYRFVESIPKRKWTCKHCNRELQISSSRTHIGTHLNSYKCGFGGSLVDYALKYYTEIDPHLFDHDAKCGYCDKLANNIDYIIDDVKETFKRIHLNMFCCTDDCKQKVFKEIWPEKQFSLFLWSKIGSTPQFISKTRNISIQDAKKLKTIKIGYENCSFEGRTSSLKDYIFRLGPEEGLKKYNERCNKIGMSNNIQYYIDKHGEEIGREKWNIKCEKAKKAALGNTKSKSCDLFLDKIETKYNIIREHIIKCNRIAKVDAKLSDFDHVIIEYYGDYWHCNPNLWEPDRYHRNLKMTASEKWAYDKNRIHDIVNTSDKKYSALIIWESSANNISDDELFDAIKYVIENKGIVHTI